MSLETLEKVSAAAVEAGRIPFLNRWLAEAFRKRHELLRRLPLNFRSRLSGFLPIRDGGIPRWGAINLQIDDHLLKFGAISLAHLVLHERLRTLVPHLVIQHA